jgi:hypothetical protein
MLHRSAVVNLLKVSLSITSVDQDTSFPQVLLTLIPFSPAAETILRLSNCSAVTPCSYLTVSKMPPVRRSQICKSDVWRQLLKKKKGSTYPNGLVQTSADDVDLVKLETSHRPRVSQERAVGLTGAHIPHPHRAVPAPTYERILPRLHRPDKILVELPASIGVWWRRHCESARGGCGTRQVSSGHRRRMGDGPEDVHRHHTLPGREVPLA